ncbi:hypothetical protein CEXT_22501 [Caerostris extrusa]|uniref:Uncharacterized protein n=1 Tax=Caerostris extrusa TaxID=172846 RepID=A0AAV4P7C6_CAEEX|nr:hypothetical protein CEXT_22501 [Caerostris extrusa]
MDKLMIISIERKGQSSERRKGRERLNFPEAKLGNFLGLLALLSSLSLLSAKNLFLLDEISLLSDYKWVVRQIISVSPEIKCSRKQKIQRNTSTSENRDRYWKNSVNFLKSKREKKSVERKLQRLFRTMDKLMIISIERKDQSSKRRKGRERLNFPKRSN